MTQWKQKIKKAFFCSLIYASPLFGADNLLQKTFERSEIIPAQALLAAHQSLSNQGDKFIWGRAAIFSLYALPDDENTQKVSALVAGLWKTTGLISHTNDSELIFRAAEFSFDMAGLITAKKIKGNAMDTLLFVKDACRKILFKRQGWEREAKILLAIWQSYPVTQDTPNWASYVLDNLSDDKLEPVEPLLRYQALVFRSIVYMKTGRTREAALSLSRAKAMFPEAFLGSLVETAWARGRDNF